MAINFIVFSAIQTVCIEHSTDITFYIIRSPSGRHLAQRNIFRNTNTKTYFSKNTESNWYFVIRLASKRVDSGQGLPLEMLKPFKYLKVIDSFN